MKANPMNGSEPLASQAVVVAHNHANHASLVAAVVAASLNHTRLVVVAHGEVSEKDIADAIVEEQMRKSIQDRMTLQCFEVPTKYAEPEFRHRQSSRERANKDAPWYRRKGKREW